MKRIISTSTAPKAIATYSQAVESNGFLFISGQIAIDPSTGKLIEGGIREQTALILKNIGEILKAAGYDFNDVVKCTCLLAKMEDYAAMNEVYGGTYNHDSPARAAFAALGLPLGALVEIETIASKT